MASHGAVSANRIRRIQMKLFWIFDIGCWLVNFLSIAATLATDIQGSDHFILRNPSKMTALFSFLLIATVLTGDAFAMTCIKCKGNGESCRDSGTNKTCPALKPGQSGACGRLTYKVNGTAMVAETCTLGEHCLGEIDCYKEGFEFAKGKVGYTDCAVVCCNSSDNCDPSKPVTKPTDAVGPTKDVSEWKCKTCEGKGDTCEGKSKACPKLPKGDKGGCGRITYKLNGTGMVQYSCMLDRNCFGSVDCYDPDFGFPGGRPGYSDCAVTCCHDGNNCEPKTLTCNKCEKKGDGVCDDKEGVVCPFKEDRCVNANYKMAGVSMVYGGCARTSDCKDSEALCKKLKGNHSSFTDCEAKCTGENGGSLAIFSFINFFVISIALLF